MNSFIAGRRAVILLTLFAGLVLWAYSAANNSLNFTEVTAEVDRIEDVCVPVGEPAENATSARCLEAETSPGGKNWWHRKAVNVRYRSPADGQEHTGTVIPEGGQSAVDALKLRSGDRWTILAHDKNPDVIKAQ